MSGSIAGYYNEELMEWVDTIRFCQEEIDEFEQKLQEVIRYNGTSSLGSHTEHLLSELALHDNAFLKLLSDIGSQENILVHKGVLVSNRIITDEVTASQAALRKRMFAAEKGFLDVKYACYDFFATALTH